MKRFLILDCYVDEPACFGVPPFISPYPRYVFGALVDAGVDCDHIDYKTIDDIRPDFQIHETYEKVFLIGGATVPGKYLGYKIGTTDEISLIVNRNAHLQFTVGGLAGRLVAEKKTGNILALSGDIELFAYAHATESEDDRFRTYKQLNRWAELGAPVCARHFEHPHLIAEIETYRGCPREQHCSFCSESIFSEICFRSVSSILAEVDALIAQGITRFRIGRQADIIAYGSSLKEFRSGFAKPEPSAVAELFLELKKRRDEKKIITLNIDNANPGTIANFPDESARIIESIADALTPGDTMPLGIESFDPEVKQRNNLKVNREEALNVIRMINEIGGRRVDGIPILLPGVNLIHGLAGESTETFRINYEALCGIRDKGLLIKRINIRSLLPFPGTEAEYFTVASNKKICNRYEYYRDKIREDIDHHMLTKIYPAGTVLKNIRVADTMFEYSLARPLQSYAITVKIPVLFDKGSFIDAVVVSHRERSILALPLPIKINSLSQKAIEFIPGVGRRAASDIVLKRPFTNLEDLVQAAPSIDTSILQLIII
jgi:radical SAM superfamily enzyme with C-terminal helix-hairpin-helix motif